MSDAFGGDGGGHAVDRVGEAADGVGAELGDHQSCGEECAEQGEFDRRVDVALDRVVEDMAGVRIDRTIDDEGGERRVDRQSNDDFEDLHGDDDHRVGKDEKRDPGDDFDGVGHGVGAGLVAAGLRVADLLEFGDHHVNLGVDLADHLHDLLLALLDKPRRAGDRHVALRGCLRGSAGRGEERQSEDERDDDGETVQHDAMVGAPRRSV